MPSHQQNYQTWNHSYDWDRYQGDEWSAKWGGPDMQWYWELYPRIRQHLPAEKILDIGPGFGRWTKFLQDHCQHMVLLDISERCIHACKERFGEDRVSYKVGSGEDLDGVEDGSIDFIFSWEALVYVETEAIGKYLDEIHRVLKNGGTAFLHHSNLGSYLPYFDRTIKLPKAIRDFLKNRRLLDYDQWRARTVTASSFRQQAQERGLSVKSQELIPWGGKRLIDCLSTLEKGGSKGEFQVIENPHFHTHAYKIQELSWLYGEGVRW